mmetsp:Transcript_36693/g.72143  ORF Transcript_36693/g.72143 Transcript_36693/m.72143 type:complete len:83 (-) Transcript_36693:147-395(-)
MTFQKKTVKAVKTVAVLFGVVVAPSDKWRGTAQTMKKTEAAAVRHLVLVKEKHQIRVFRDFLNAESVFAIFCEWITFFVRCI